jgi:hypothetical protein
VDRSGDLAALDTLTHARLRARHGDVRGARRILERILAGSPDDAEVRELLASLDARADAAPAEPPEEPAGVKEPGDPRRLAAEFRAALGGAGRPATRTERIARLERWLARVRRG